MESFNSFKDALSSEERHELEEIYEKKTKELNQVLNEEIVRDNEHLELVNLCYNLFTKTTEINKATGYRVVLVDPLYTVGIKNFDLMLYNESSQSAVLIEAKSSISERGIGSTIDETVQAANQALSNKEKLELFVGYKIAKIEFVILSFAYYTNELKDAVISKNTGLCLWAYHVVPGLIQMLKMGEDVYSEQSAGRMHSDEGLRQTLLKTVSTRMGALRSLPIMPTSHMFAKLEYIGQQLFSRLDKQPPNQRWFGYSEVYNLCKQVFSPTELDDSQLEDETRRIIDSAIGVGLFRRINEEDEIPRMEFEISYGRRDYEKFKKDYLEKRSKEKAYDAAVEEFRHRKGVKKLEEFKQ
jgi:hypothetical protein